MLNRTQQILIGVVALAVLGMLWLTGNHEAQQEEPAPEPVTAASAAVPEPNAGARGVPKNGTLDPISIDPNRSTDILPQYQADTLVDDYQENTGAANDRYLGKYFIVEGVASGVRREGNDTVFLDIRSNNPSLLVRAKLLPIQICGPAGRTCEVEARGTMVRRGQKVAVECTGAGQVEGSPALDGCLVRGGAN